MRFLAAALFSVLALHASDDEMRVVNVIVDRYVEDVQTWWSELRPNDETLRGRAADLHATTLAVSVTTIAPLREYGYLHEDLHEASARDFAAIRTSLLFKRYATARPVTLDWLRSRRDLLLVPKSWDDPEQFYARYPHARGLLRVSKPAVIGDEALIYAQLLMVYSEEGRLFYLRKEHGRWRVQWVVTLLDVPGC